MILFIFGMILSFYLGGWYQACRQVEHDEAFFMALINGDPKLLATIAKYEKILNDPS